MTEYLPNTTHTGVMTTHNTSLSFVNNTTSEPSGNVQDALGVTDYINIVLIPSCFIIGILGNLVTIILMNTRMFSKMASRYFLTALAWTDISVLLTQPLRNINFIRFVGQDIRSVSNIGCKIYFWFLSNGKMMSSWLVVLMLLERFAAVKFPFKVKSWFSRRNSLISIVVLYIILGGWNAGYSHCTAIDGNGICNQDAYAKIDPTSESFCYGMVIGCGTFYFFLPFIILTIFTPLLIASLFQSKQLQEKMTNAQGKQIDMARPTTMLMSVVFAYIIFVTPIGITHLISKIVGISMVGVDKSAFFIFRDVSLILELMNYTINFFLYVCSSKKFRDAFCSVILSGRFLRTSTRSGAFPSTDTSSSFLQRTQSRS